MQSDFGRKHAISDRRLNLFPRENRMSETPNDIKYAASHEWARKLEDNIIEVGISDYAQAALGDVVYVELPDVDSDVALDDEIMKKVFEAKQLTYQSLADGSREEARSEAIELQLIKMVPNRNVQPKNEPHLKPLYLLLKHVIF